MKNIKSLIAFLLCGVLLILPACKSVGKLSLSGNELKVILLTVGLLSIIILGLGGIAFTIALYTIFSIVKAIIVKGKKGGDA